MASMDLASCFRVLQAVYSTNYNYMLLLKKHAISTLLETVLNFYLRMVSTLWIMLCKSYNALNESLHALNGLQDNNFEITFALKHKHKIPMIFFHGPNGDTLYYSFNVITLTSLIILQISQHASIQI